MKINRFSFGLLALLVLQPFCAWSASFSVSKFIDTNDGICDGDCSLREAIISANATPETDQITLQAGTYSLSISGILEDLAATGDLDIRSGVTISGVDPASTIIDGADTNRIFHIDSPNGVDAIEVVIENVTLQNGRAEASNGGGAVLNGELTTTILRNVILSDNVSANISQASISGNGGAIYNYGNMVVEDAIISNNLAQLNQDISQGAFIGGGGIYNAETGDMTVRRSTFTNNHASNSSVNGFASGGAVFNSGTLLITEDCVIGGDDAAAGNSAPSGGGIANFGGFLTVSRTLIRFNVANYSTGGGGGAVFATNAGPDAGSLLITGSSLLDNQAFTLGGGVFVALTPVTITNSTVARNRTYYLGGGVAVVGGVNSTITNSTIAFNEAGVFDNDIIGPAPPRTNVAGGGLYTNGQVNIASSTFFANKAVNDVGTILGNQIFLKDSSDETGTGPNPPGQGPQLGAPPEITLSSVILAHGTVGNTATDNTQNCDGAIEFIRSEKYNIDSGASCNLDPVTFGDIIDTDPLLSGELLDNGGPTQTIALLPGSPAIDTRPVSGCPSLDQRFFSRPDGLCDTGAFELDGEELAPNDTIADLKIDMTENEDPVQVEVGQLVFTVKVTNFGPNDALGVTTTVTLPEQITIDPSASINFFDDATGSCQIATPEVICDLGRVPAFQEIGFSITTTPSIIGTASTTATVAAANPNSDYFQLNNTVTITTDIIAGGPAEIPGFPPGGGSGHLNWITLLLFNLLIATRWWRDAALKRD